METSLKNFKPDVVLFGGGLDVNPALYHHSNVGSHCDGPQVCRRDLYELTIWNMVKRLGIPTLGICRGAQFTCAMSGGALYQDVGGHTVGHVVEFVDGDTLPMTSTHHQMMMPWPVKHELLAWAAERKSAGYTFDKRMKDANKYITPPDNKEPEIVYFPDTKALAVQGHPEYYDPMNPTVVKVRALVNRYLLKGAMPNV